MTSHCASKGHPSVRYYEDDDIPSGFHTLPFTQSVFLSAADRPLCFHFQCIKMLDGLALGLGHGGKPGIHDAMKIEGQKVTEGWLILGTFAGLNNTGAQGKGGIYSTHTTHQWQREAKHIGIIPSAYMAVSCYSRIL